MLANAKGHAGHLSWCHPYYPPPPTSSLWAPLVSSGLCVVPSAEPSRLIQQLLTLTLHPLCHYNCVESRGKRPRVRFMGCSVASGLSWAPWTFPERLVIAHSELGSDESNFFCFVFAFLRAALLGSGLWCCQGESFVELLCCLWA